MPAGRRAVWAAFFLLPLPWTWAERGLLSTLPGEDVVMIITIMMIITEPSMRAD